MRGQPLGETEYEFSNHTCILYSLGIGASKDPLKEDDLKFTYELNDEFTSFPTQGVLTMFGSIDKMLGCPGLPAFNPMMLLHGEQRIDIHQLPAPGTKTICKSSAVDVADKGKGALLTTETDAYDEEGTKLVTATAKYFIRGIGGFGDKGVRKDKLSPIPEREPDATWADTTTENQALIYRLSGDLNPLHADANMAAMGGFEKPILHGLCSYGYCARAVYETYCGGDANNIKSVSSRFTSHVFPGETFEVGLWVDGNKVIFEAKTKERGKVVCIGEVELRNAAKL